MRELTLFDRHPGKGLELLREGKVDLAIALESQVPRHFCSYWWLRGHFVLMLPRGHELTRISSPGLEKYPNIPLSNLFPMCVMRLPTSWSRLSSIWG